MPLDRFQKLKHRVTNEKDLSKVWLYFSDNFMSDSEFLDGGDRTSDSFVEAVLPKVCAQMFGKEDKIKDLFLISVPEHNFIHGGFMVGGRIGQLIYFTSSQLGVVAIPNRLDQEHTVGYARFGNPMKRRSPVNLNLN